MENRHWDMNVGELNRNKSPKAKRFRGSWETIWTSVDLYSRTDLDAKVLELCGPGVDLIEEQLVSLPDGDAMKDFYCAEGAILSSTKCRFRIRWRYHFKLRRIDIQTLHSHEHQRRQMRRDILPPQVEALIAAFQSQGLPASAIVPAVHRAIESGHIDADVPPTPTILDHFKHLQKTGSNSTTIKDCRQERAPSPVSARSILPESVNIELHAPVDIDLPVGRAETRVGEGTNGAVRTYADTSLSEGCKQLIRELRTAGYSVRSTFGAVERAVESGRLRGELPPEATVRVYCSYLNTLQPQPMLEEFPTRASSRKRHRKEHPHPEQHDWNTNEHATSSDLDDRSVPVPSEEEHGALSKRSVNAVGGRCSDFWRRQNSSLPPPRRPFVALHQLIKRVIHSMHA